MKGLTHWHSTQYRVAAAVNNISTDEADSPSSKKGKIRETMERAFETIQLNKAFNRIIM